MLGTTLGSVYGLPLGLYDGLGLVLSEDSADGTADNKIDSLLLEA